MNYEARRVVDAEGALLGCILMDGSRVIDRLGLRLDRSDFSIFNNQFIWDAISKRYRNDDHIDLVTITNDLLGKVDGEYLIHLFQGFVSTAEAPHYAKIVRTNAIKEKTILRIEGVKNELLEGKFEGKEDIFRMVGSIEESIRDDVDSKVSNAEEYVPEYIQYLGKKEHRMRTGFPQFDEWCRGIGKGWLYVLAARPGVGKTAKMLQMAIYMSQIKRGVVIVFSQEMKKEDLLDRIISTLTNIPLKRFMEKEFTSSDHIKITEALELIEVMDIHVVDSGAVTIEEVRAISRQLKRKHKEIGAIFIDYLGIMNIPQTKGMTRAQEIGEVTKKAKQLAMTLQTPVVLLAQLNRETTKSQRPSLSHLRDSGDIEQDADIVEFLWHDSEDTTCREHDDAIVVQSMIAKGRQIGVNNFRYAFKGWNQRFYDLPPRSDR